MYRNRGARRLHIADELDVHGLIEAQRLALEFDLLGAGVNPGFANGGIARHQVYEQKVSTSSIAKTTNKLTRRFRRKRGQGPSRPVSQAKVPEFDSLRSVSGDELI